MKSRYHLKHSVIVHYIQNDLTENEKKLVEKCKQDSEYALIFNLIDSVSEPPLRSGITSQEHYLSYLNAEESFIHILSGNASMKEKQRFVNTLYQSGDVCEKLMQKLDEIQDEESDDEVLSNIDIKNDTVLLDYLNQAIKVPASPPHYTLKKQISRLFTTIAHIVKNELYPPHRWIKYATVGLVPVILLSLYFHADQKNDIFNSYFNKNSVPQEYNDSSLRCCSQEMGVSSQFDTFISGFKYGVSDYLMRDYADALKIWQPLRRYANILEKNIENEQVQYAIRDYYFYLGITQLAMLKDKTSSKEKQKDLLKGALSDLNRALDIALVRKSKNRDREHFFLGLAYVVAGQEDFAKNQLKMIQPDSPFYKDRGELIKRIDSN